MISLTPSAVQHLESLLSERGEAGQGLRLYVERGGCAGLQYGMTLDTPGELDTTFSEGGVQVIVDPESFAHLRNATVDYCDDLTGTGFRIRNPNAQRSCGCGTSFEPAGAEAEAHQHS